MSLRTGFLLFLFFNILLYGFLILFNHTIKFDQWNYTHDAYHFIEDPRAHGGPFELMHALGMYDAQFYLAIATDGYPAHATFLGLHQDAARGTAAYAFFPLYPLALSVTNFFLHNIQLSAFVFTNVVLCFLFVSFYTVLSKLYEKNTAVKTIFLLFFFPFSIFFRSYFTEGLFLLELIWFSYFLLRKKWLLAGAVEGLLTVTHVRGLLIWIVLFFVSTRQLLQKKIPIHLWLTTNAIGIAPFIMWLLYCQLNTGNAFISLTIKHFWSPWPWGVVFFHTLSLMTQFFSLPLHSFHYSQIDIAMIIIIGILLFVSRKKLKFELWLISFLLWIVPLFGQDTMSYTRSQIVSFPLFLFLAQKLRGVSYAATLYVFALLLLLFSLAFVNWYWLG